MGKSLVYRSWFIDHREKPCSYHGLWSINYRLPTWTMIYQLWTKHNKNVTFKFNSSQINTYICIFVAKAIFVLKKHRYHIIHSWILLLCFVTGQYMVYAHQHNIIKNSVKVFHVAKTSAKQTLTEKCQLCDAMHHNGVVLNNQVYFNTVATAEHVFRSVEYSFTSIQLILSSGRAPPSSGYRS